MRLGTAAALTATTVLGAGAAAAAVGGRYAGARALRPQRERPLPGDPWLTVHSATGDRVTLTRSLASLRPGVYGLSGTGVHAVVGAVDEDAPHPPDTVVRHLERVSHGRLTPGSRVRLTPQVYARDPGAAFGFDHADVQVDAVAEPGGAVAAESGPLPAWYLPGSRDTWVITVHGLGTTREHPMVVMPLLRRCRVPVLDIALRGDADAPAGSGTAGRLGTGQWRDVDAALHHAVRQGARRVVLHGWSTGATAVLHAALHTSQAERVCGLVLDSPVLDWRATVRNLAAGHHVPGPLLPLAVRAAEGIAGAEADDLDRLERADGLRWPTLVMHGPDDTVTPWHASQAFAARHPSRVALHTVANAPHAAMWNADPDRYEETLRRFLVPLM